MGEEMGGKQYRAHSVEPRTAAPLLVTVVLLLLGLLIVSYQTELSDNTVEGLLSKLMWKNATVRPPVLLVLIIAGWGVVVRVCRNSALNVDHVLGGRLQTPAATYQAALALLCVVLTAHLVHYVASMVPGLSWRPWLTCNLALHVVIALVGTTPCAGQPHAPIRAACRRREQGKPHIIGLPAPGSRASAACAGCQSSIPRQDSL